MEKEELKDRIDDEETEMTDKEKRETYRAEIANQSDYEDWCDRGGTR